MKETVARILRMMMKQPPLTAKTAEEPQTETPAA